MSDQAMTVCAWSRHLLQTQYHLNAVRSELRRLRNVKVEERPDHHDGQFQACMHIEAMETVNEVGCYVYCALHYGWPANDEFCPNDTPTAA